MGNFERKGISPVLGIVLLLIMAVIGTMFFYFWIGSYGTGVYSDAEGRTKTYSVDNLVIGTIVGNSLYVTNGMSENLTVLEVKIGSVDCGISQELVPKVNEINITGCVDNLTGKQSVVVSTNQTVIQKYLYIR